MRYFITRTLFLNNFVNRQGSLRLTVCRLTSTSHAPTVGEVLSSKLGRYISFYEEITGLRKVLWAQNRVIELEQQVIVSQSERRELSRSLDSVRTRMRELNSELETTTRGDAKYVQIVTQEHRLLTEEKSLMKRLQIIENEERDLFSSLSSAVRESHEMERARAERTKYWGIIATLVGTAIGVIGTTLNNWFKMRELRKIVKDATHIKEEVRYDVDEIVRSYLIKDKDPSLSKVMDETFSRPTLQQMHSELCQLILEQENSTRTAVLQQHNHLRHLVYSGFAVTLIIYIFLK